MPKPKRNIQAVAEETLTPPDDLPQGQKIARVKSAAGNNLYNLELPGDHEGEAFSTILAELPSKFRSTIWIKRGNFVVVDATALADRGNKLGGEIVNIVRDEKRWRKMKYWPKEFEKSKQEVYGGESDEEEDEGPKMPTDDEDED
ncbi:S1-like domain-containing protein [Pseudocercospora fuligena]|uniref:S1-like domain-containing protein n=1 Tax=Pseudocercospora fuligena TaxID=685502 RepID=A0A8H6RLV4_9PEZI|nr:S1-like domain-containing protein [Pseudocercospora fuligena]